MVAAIAVGAALRFATVGLQSLDEDETVTVWLLHHPLGSMLATIPHTESTPPLYYVLAWLWTRATGTGTIGVRSLSALIGVATIPVAYAAARQLASETAGRVAAVLVALSPGLIWYSQEARAYALLALLSAASLLTLGRALDGLRGDEGTRGDLATIRRRIAWWALIAALALTTHYFAAFLVAPECAWLLFAARRNRAREALVATGAVGVVGLALLPLALSQQGNGGTNWLGLIPLWGRLQDVPPQMMLGDGRPFYKYFALAVWTAALLPLLVLLIRGRGKAQRGAIVVTVVALCGIALPTLIDLAGMKIVADRNAMGAAAVALIGCAIGMAARPRLLGLAALVVVVGLFAWDTEMVVTNALMQREDWRDAARALGQATVPRAVVYGPATNNPGPVPPLVPFQAVYLPSLRTMPDRGATVRELDELNVRDDLSDTSPPPNPVSPGHGWRLLGRAGSRTFTLYRWLAPGPVHVIPDKLIPAGLVENRDDSDTLVGLQLPGHGAPATSAARSRP